MRSSIQTPRGATIVELQQFFDFVMETRAKEPNAPEPDRIKPHFSFNDQGQIIAAYVEVTNSDA